MRLVLPFLLTLQLAAQVTTVGSCQTGGNPNGFTTPSVGNTAGATLFAFWITDYASGGAPCSGAVTDQPTGSGNSNNIWSCVLNTPTGGNVKGAIWYSYHAATGGLVTGSAHTFTFTQGGAYPGGAIQAFTGTLTSADPLRVHSEAAGASSTIQPGSITGSAGELIFSGVGSGGGFGYTVSAPLSTGCSIAQAPGSREGVGIGWQLSSSGAVNPTWSNVFVSGNVASVAAFKISSCHFTSPAGYLNLGFVGQAYSYTPQTAGCTSPTFSIASGSLPAGLSLNSSTGAITGTPSAIGTSSFALQVSSGATDSKAEQIKVAMVSAASVSGNSAATVRGFWTTDEAGDTKISCTDGTSTWSSPVVDPIRAGSSAWWGVTGHALSLILYHPAGAVTCTGYSTYVTGGTGAVALGSTSVLAALASNPVKIANDAGRTRHKMTWDGSIGSSGDIKFPTWAADGTVLVNSNDSFGKALSATNYCCSGHVIEEKWAADMRSSITMLGGSINGAAGNLPFGGPNGIADIGWLITGGSCSSTNVATVTFLSQGWTPPVGTPIWVTTAVPSFFNVSNAAITAASPTSFSYPTTCTSGTAWTSGGKIIVWNDGTYPFTFGIISVSGTVYLMPWRSNGAPSAQTMIKSTDYWATTLNSAHNTGPSATPVAGWDVWLPSDTCYFSDCSAHALQFLQPCQDYGGTNMAQFPCSWQAGTDARIYALEVVNQATNSGYRLWYIRPEDLRLSDGSKWYIFQGSQADSDVPLQDSQWLPFSTANAASGTMLNSTVNAWGNSAQMVYLPSPFNRFVQLEWSALKTIAGVPNAAASSPSISQSAGAVLYDHGIYPWGTPQVAGSINSDPSDTSYAPTWSRCYNSTFASISSNPPVAKLTCGMSGSYLNGGSGGAPAVMEYGPSVYDLYLTQRAAGAGSGPGAISAVVKFDGDSLTAGNGASGPAYFYPQVATDSLHALGYTSVDSQNLGVSGSLIAAHVPPPAYSATYPLNILVTWLGTNDVSTGRTALQIQSDLRSYWTQARAAGYKIVAYTLQTLPANDSVRLAANALIAGDSSYYDALVDLASDPILGCAGASCWQSASVTNTPCNVSSRSNQQMHSDIPADIHLANAGYAYVACLATPVIKGLLTAPPVSALPVTEFGNPSLSYPRFSFNGGGNKHIANGLELFYDWTSCVTAGSVWKNLAPNPTGNWDTTLSQIQTMLCDPLGLKSFGWPTTGVFGANDTAHLLPVQLVVGSGFNKALTDFTIIWAGKHLPSANDGPPSNECIFSSATLGLCRNGTSANSWKFTVPDGTTAAQAVTTDGSNFGAVAMVRSGSTSTFYSNAAIPATGQVSSLTTISGSTTTGNNTLYVGGKTGPTQAFWGYESYLLVWNRALSTEELRGELTRLRAEIARAGGTLP